MDLFHSVISTQASPELTNTLMMNQQTVWNNLSDHTRETLKVSTSAISAITPLATADQIERVKAKIGTIFDTTIIEALNTTYALQTSNLHTALTTLAHPTIGNMHRLGQTDAYGEEYNALRNNLIYSRVVSGFGGLDGTDNYVITNHADNYNGEDVTAYNSLSVFGKQTIHRNWNTALTAIFDDGVDIGSVHSGSF